MLFPPREYELIERQWSSVLAARQRSNLWRAEWDEIFGKLSTAYGKASELQTPESWDDVCNIGRRFRTVMRQADGHESQFYVDLVAITDTIEMNLEKLADADPSKLVPRGELKEWVRYIDEERALVRKERAMLRTGQKELRIKLEKVEDRLREAQRPWLDFTFISFNVHEFVAALKDGIIFVKDALSLLDDPLFQERLRAGSRNLWEATKSLVHAVKRRFSAFRLPLLDGVSEDIFEEMPKTFRQVSADISTFPPAELFSLVREIAIMSDKIPTLYVPARSRTERVFMSDTEYFSKVLPRETATVVDILRKWIEPASHKNIKFLGSDLIGKYRIKQLRDDLLRYCEPRLLRWSTLDTGEQDWVLNYKWAASRCEEKMYSSLGALLLKTPYLEIQEWILFVPLQMPDKEFIKIIDDYVSKRKELPPSALSAVIKALAALNANECPAAPVLVKHKEIFSRPAILEEIEQAWQERGMKYESGHGQDSLQLA